MGEVCSSLFIQPKSALACSKFVQTKIGTTGLFSPHQVPCGTGPHFLYGSEKHGSAYLFCVNAANTRPTVSKKNSTELHHKVYTPLLSIPEGSSASSFRRGLSPSPSERVGPGRHLYRQLSSLMWTSCARKYPRATLALFTPQKIVISNANPASRISSSGNNLRNIGEGEQ